MKLAFTKMHGAGNDFVVIDATRAPFRPEPALLARLTDRRSGVGCDQVLVVEPPATADVDFNYRIFNADGSEVGQCGNGARALARFVAAKGLSDKPRLRVRTATAAMELEQRPGGSVRVNMGVPRFEPAEIPLAVDSRRLRYEVRLAGDQRVIFGAASLGNPHAVIAVGDVEAAPVAALGAALQRETALFPQSVNVGFLQIVDAGRVRLRVYERGAGETPACGSGACAAVAVGRQWDMLGETVEVEQHGGALTIEWAGAGQPLFMTGPAEFVFEGEIEWPN